MENLAIESLGSDDKEIKKKFKILRTKLKVISRALESKHKLR